jgi:hypothetical protein
MRFEPCSRCGARIIIQSGYDPDADTVRTVILNDDGSDRHHKCEGSLDSTKSSIERGINEPD